MAIRQKSHFTRSHRNTEVSVLRPQHDHNHHYPCQRCHPQHHFNENDCYYDHRHEQQHYLRYSSVGGFLSKLVLVVLIVYPPMGAVGFLMIPDSCRNKIGTFQNGIHQWNHGCCGNCDGGSSSSSRHWRLQNRRRDIDLNTSSSFRKYRYQRFAVNNNNNLSGATIQQNDNSNSNRIVSPNDHERIRGSAARTNSTVNGNNSDDTTVAVQHDIIMEVNTLYNSRVAIVYDPVQERYVRQKSNNDFLWTESTVHHQTRTMDVTNTPKNKVMSIISSLPQWIRNQNGYWQEVILQRLTVAFVPSGVTSNYYRFMQWRILQRFINANLHVFGTQSLLLGLGIRNTANSQLMALSAALKWVLKDALGKIVRMVWASRMGLRFDSDAKRWRMRSAYCFALGNGLEIATYIFPHMFLVWATAANCCKQISMLTSSSTRSSIFLSFRDGTRENIADITAKGEAQVAVVDLLGIASGVWLSKAVVGTSIRSILAVYAILQTLEMCCVYKELRAVEYRVFNFERMITIINGFCRRYNVIRTTNNNNTILTHTDDPTNELCMESPKEMARTERMFLPPHHLARRNTSFGSLGRCKLSPNELEHLIQIFANERFLLVVGENVKFPRHRSQWHKAAYYGRFFFRQRDRITNLQENCHIVLHVQANNIDIVKSILALTLLRQELSKSSYDPATVRTSDLYDSLEWTIRETNQLIGPLLRQISKQGWETPARNMFGNVKMRAEWKLLEKSGLIASSPIDSI